MSMKRIRQMMQSLDVMERAAASVGMSPEVLLNNTKGNELGLLLIHARDSAQAPLDMSDANYRMHATLVKLGVIK